MAEPTITYCGWGYEPGPRGAALHVFLVGEALVLGVANARYEADEDGHCIEWDRVGSLPLSCVNVVGANLPWPPPRDLVLGDLTDEQRDDTYDLLREELREVLRD